MEEPQGPVGARGSTWPGGWEKREGFMGEEMSELRPKGPIAINREEE